MSQLDDLLSRSRAPGRFVERRRFSLSREKAIEKLREFSLRNPRQYVLELVQAAVFSGASYIAVDVDHERMLLAWVGSRPFRRNELEHVFDYLFADRGASGTRHLVQLAIGLNALLQRKPKLLRVESGDGTLDGTVRMDLDRRGNGVLGIPEDPLAGTYVLAELGTSWLKRFQGDSWTPEAGLIESECRYTPVPILLNSRAPFGWKASRSISWLGNVPHRSFDSGGRRGVVAISQPGQTPGFQLVVGGVRITTTPLPELGELPARPAIGRSQPQPLTGVICDDELRKTADQSDIVRDRRFAAMLHAVQPHATELLRSSEGPAYVPPRLPELGEAVADSAEPVPDPIPMLLPRPPISLAGLEQLAEGAPCFWVQPADVPLLQAAADPGRLPHPVLVLTPGQVLTLDKRLPDLALHRLNSPADVEFVRRALEQRHRQRQVEIPFRSEIRAGVQGMLRLQLVLDGAVPCWADPAEGDLPVRIAAGGRSTGCRMELLGLPGLSVALEVERDPGGLDNELSGEILDRALLEAFRLVPEDPAPVEQAAVRRFVAGLLAAHVRPHFVRDRSSALPPVGGGSAEGRGEGDVEPRHLARLTVHLPVAWGEAARRMCRVPLASTTAGPLTLERLIALQGTTDFLELVDPADLKLLAPLEERLGLCHLLAPPLQGLPLVAVRLPHGWEWWGDKRWDIPGVKQVVGLALSFGPAFGGPLSHGWVPHPTDIPLVQGLRRKDEPVEDPLPGLTLLHRHLLRMAGEAGFARLARPDLPEIRVRAAAELALLHLSAWLGRLQEDPLLPRASTGGTISLARLMEHPDFALSPRHGPALDEPHTALVSLDELRVLETHLDKLPPLRFDDPPEIWASLLEPEGASSHWLLRHEVRIPGIRGWLGLRLPFDGSSGVLLQGSGTLVALTELDRAVPVHGLLQLTTGQLAPSRPQRELLQLARQQLYQELATLLLQGVLDPARELASQRYAMAYAHASFLEAGGRLIGTAAQLAERVQVLTQDGAFWGTLRRWFESVEPDRPPLPVPLPALSSAREAPVARHDGNIDRRLVELADRLSRAAGSALGTARIRIEGAWLEEDELVALHERWSDASAAVLLLNLGHPLSFRVDKGDPSAAELCLLAWARLLVRWGARTGHELDLLELQRVLVAQRLG